MMLEDFIRKELVRKGTPDRGLASSLKKIAELRIKNLPSGITDENSFLVIENCYEAVKELIDALMAVAGYKSYSHEASVEFLKEFHKEVPSYKQKKASDFSQRLRFLLWCCSPREAADFSPRYYGEHHIINQIDRYRILRNDIVYRGLITTVAEGRQASIELKGIFGLLSKLVDAELNKGRSAS